MENALPDLNDENSGQEALDGHNRVVEVEGGLLESRPGDEAERDEVDSDEDADRELELP